MTGDLLKQGIAALNAGRKEEARRLLMRFVQQDERNEMGWLWLSGAVDTDEDRRVCLENVLAINPSSESAQQGIQILRKSSPGSSSTTDAMSLGGIPTTRPVAEASNAIKSQPGTESHRSTPQAEDERVSSRSTERHSNIARDDRKSSTGKEIVIAQKRVGEPSRRPHRWSVANWMTLCLILLLAGAQVWTFERISRLEKALTETQAQTVILANGLDRVADELVRAANELDRVAIVAENANRYAHSHW